MYIKVREAVVGGPGEVPHCLLQSQGIFSGNFPLGLDFLLTR